MFMCDVKKTPPFARNFVYYKFANGDVGKDDNVALE